MGFLSTLGKIGAGIAAPFTGGASLAAIPAIDAIGAGMSGAAGSMAHNRGTQAQLELDSQRQIEEQLLRREMEKRTARNDAMRQSVFGSMLANYQPQARPAGMPQSPFNLGDIGSRALQFGSQDALGRLQGGDQMPALQRPDVSKLAKPGFLERVLGIGGAVAGAYGAASRPRTGA